MENKNLKNQIKEHLGVLLLFTVLTLILTYPVIARVTNHAAGDGGDGFQFKWNIWHVNRVLTEGGGIADIYYTDYQYYPNGTSLAFSTLSLTNTLFLAFPLTLITDNLALIYNILFFLTFILAGYGMYLLVHYLVGNKVIAFLVGFAYSFSPIHMAWGMGFLNLMSINWTPFFFLFFFKMFEEQKMRNVVIAAIFLFFLTLASWYHILFAFLIAVSYFIYKFITDRHLFTKDFFIRVAVFLFLFSIITLPFIVPVISDYLAAEKDYYTRPFYKIITPLNYILPSVFNSFWGENVKRLYLPSGRGWPLLDSVVSPGYLVLFLSLFYLIKTRRNFFWFFIALFFFVLSLAPYFAVLTSFLKSLFAFNIISVIARFSFGVLFSLLLLFSFALRDFWSSWENKIKEKCALPVKRARMILGVILFIILTVEYVAVPYPTTYEHRKREMRLAGEIGKVLRGPHPVFGDNFVVLTLPSHFHYCYSEQFDLYLQTFHQKKITGGYLGLKDPGSGQNLRELGHIIQIADANKFQEFLENYNVGYIIFYADILEGRVEGMDKNIIFLLKQTSVRLVTFYQNIYDTYIFQVFPETAPENE